uniref:Uncharacterized protein n=1 Tax=Avena sativa TaxID=4498 RepID=A0ACD6AMB2_AVESA
MVATTVTLQQQASTPPPHLTLLDSVLVAPSAPAPETASLPLTFFDVFWLNSTPVERVFFYRLTSDDAAGAGDGITAILSNLRTSLSRALGVFYPLAGRLRLAPGTDDRHQLHYQQGDSVTFAVAEYDVDVDDLATDEPREVAKILPLVPTLPAGGAVLAVQATVLRGGRGLAVGLVLHHAACDGASCMRFLHTWAWAAAATDARAPPPPVINRGLVEDPSCLYDVFVKGQAASSSTIDNDNKRDDVKMADDLLLATFTLSQQDIERVKDVVVVAAGARPPRCSSLVATLGFVWSCHQRAKDDAASNVGSGGGETPSTYFILPIDHRSRVKPGPIPAEYFGNCLGAAMHAAPKNQLAAADASGIVAGCTAVATAIGKAVGEGGIGSPELWKEMIRQAVASGGGLLTVAGSPRFRVYDIDFGFGRPAKVEVVSVARTGALAVAESRPSCGGGGIEVCISLPPDDMRRFQNCFRKAITWLRH